LQREVGHLGKRIEHNTRINVIIQTARRRARGFRNFKKLKAICNWMAGDLNLKIPSAFTHPVLRRPYYLT
jgi:hypothetical protein